jgi:hypothetical protein
MITAPAGAYFVSQRCESKTGKPYWRTLPVAAFDDDGDPLVIEDRSCMGLSPPSGDWSLCARSTSPLIPADGWSAVYREEDGIETRYPLVCWSFDEDGELVGMDTADREIVPARTASNFVRYEHVTHQDGDR